MHVTNTLAFSVRLVAPISFFLTLCLFSVALIKPTHIIIVTAPCLNICIGMCVHLYNHHAIANCRTSESTHFKWHNIQIKFHQICPGFWDMDGHEDITSFICVSYVYHVNNEIIMYDTFYTKTLQLSLMLIQFSLNTHQSTMLQKIVHRFSVIMKKQSVFEWLVLLF